MLQVPVDGSTPAPTEEQENTRNNDPEAGQLQAASDDEASYEAKMLRKLFDAKMDSTDGVPETTRQPNVVMTDEPRNEEKYIAKMPNGAFCVISHEDGKVIKCFDTRREAENFLKRKPKKDYDNIEELGVSLEEAEVLMESQFEIEPENVKHLILKMSLTMKRSYE